MSLLETNPELLSLWHTTKNLPLLPEQVSKGSHKKVVWLCPNGHEWEAMVYGVSKCPTCKYLKAKVNVLEKYPEVAKLWDYSKNNIDIKDTGVKDQELYWWICEMGHEWYATASNRYKGAGCLHCSKSGYKPLEPAILYFIHNEKLASYKVGITNTKRNRLLRFHRLGWKVLSEIEYHSGFVIKKMESEFFNWLRKDNNIPQHLFNESFGYVMGATETFLLHAFLKKML